MHSFRNQVANTLTSNINLSTSADTLAFRTSGDISLSVTAESFQENGSNAASDTGYVEAILSGNTEDSYYAYLHIISNGIDYSDTINHTPELLLTITYSEDGADATPINSGITADGNNLTYTTQKGVSGFDITGLGANGEVLISIRNSNSIISTRSKSERYN